MSDYLSRLVQRSLGLAPRIEPLIAPIHAPSDQTLSERAETPAAFESDPAATIKTSPQDAPPGVAVNAGSVELAPSRTESQPPRLSPIPAPQAEFPIQKKDDWPHSPESPPGRLSHKTSEALRVEARPASPPALPPLPNATDTSSKEPALQPEIVKPLEPAAPLQSKIMRPLKPAVSPVVPAMEPSPGEPPGLPRSTTVTPERATQTVLQPEIRNAVPPPLPALESLKEEPPSVASTTTTAPERTTQIVVQPEIRSRLKPAASPLVAERQSSPNEPPAIHVTIGRVEVRAVLPQPGTPKVESPAVPRLSLADYLKQRNGGASE
jgi:hypothetical protein